jgi:hypothetical protein
MPVTPAGTVTLHSSADAVAPAGVKETVKPVLPPFAAPAERVIEGCADTHPQATSSIVNKTAAEFWKRSSDLIASNSSTAQLSKCDALDLRFSLSILRGVRENPTRVW